MKLRVAEALDLSTSLIWIDDEPFPNVGWIGGAIYAIVSDYMV